MNSTLMHASLSFPELMMPNTPAAFGLPDTIDGKNLKRIMSLGRMRLCPDEVLARAAGGKLKDSAVYKLRVIRSQLQGIVNAKTFPFLGICRSVPDGNLKEVNAFETVLRKDFLEAVELFTQQKPAMQSESVKYWNEHRSLLKLTEGQITTGISAVMSAICFADFSFDVRYMEIKPVNEQIDPTAKIEIIEAKKVVIEQSKAKMEADMKQFREECITSLRDRFNKAFSDALVAVKSGKYNQKTFNALLREIDGFEAMNVWKDVPLAAMLEDAKANMSQWKAKIVKKGKSTDGITTHLGGYLLKLQSLEATSAVMQEFDAGDGRMIEMEPF